MTLCFSLLFQVSLSLQKQGSLEHLEVKKPFMVSAKRSPKPNGWVKCSITIKLKNILNQPLNVALSLPEWSYFILLQLDILNEIFYPLEQPETQGFLGN